MNVMKKILIYEASMRGKLDATHRIAKSMLECGVEVDIVMKSTGLAREEIEKIKKRGLEIS